MLKQWRGLFLLALLYSTLTLSVQAQKAPAGKKQPSAGKAPAMAGVVPGSYKTSMLMEGDCFACSEGRGMFITSGAAKGKKLKAAHVLVNPKGAEQGLELVLMHGAKAGQLIIAGGNSIHIKLMPSGSGKLSAQLSSQNIRLNDNGLFAGLAHYKGSSEIDCPGGKRGCEPAPKMAMMPFGPFQSFGFEPGVPQPMLEVDGPTGTKAVVPVIWFELE